jgi:RHS repeat-associated protein
MPVAGLPITWDTRLMGVDRFGFGSGWAIGGLALVDVDGGVRVFPASGGVFDMEASSPTGLSGYPTDGVRFVAGEDTVSARADGSVGARASGYRLTELGGSRTYFSAEGDPIASIDRFGKRRDWVWADGTAHRLVSTIDEHGVVTHLDWADQTRVVITRCASPADASGRSASRPRPKAILEHDGRRVTGVVDASGARTAFGYDESGRLGTVGAASGAFTAVDWQVLHDGVAAVERVRVLDGDGGVEMSRRTWSVVAGTVSGWPEADGARSVLAAQGGAASQTVLGDGATEVRSKYDARGRLTGQDLAVSTRSGAVTLREQRVDYPADASPEHTGGVRDRPNRLRVTHYDPVGASRTVEERYVYDAYGRLTSHTAPDGSVTETVYDDHSAVDGVPVGLATGQRMTASDGLVAEVRSELNREHSAVIATERWTGDRDVGEARVSREEFEHAADGTVVEHRAFEQGGAGTPKVTTWQRTVDAVAGTMRVAETVGAGTEIAATTVELTDLVLGASIASTDPVGNTIETEFDAMGRPVATTAPGGRVTRSEYRSAQHDGRNAVTVIAPDGVTVTEERDVLGRVVRISDNIDVDEHGVAVPVEGTVRTVETRAYPDPSTVQVTDAWGQTTSARKDVFGRVVRAQAPGGIAEITSYDDVGNRRSTGFTSTGDLADAEHVQVSRLDVRGEVLETTVTREDGVQMPMTTRTLDGFGRETSANDEVTTVETSFDPLGNPVRVATQATASEQPGGLTRRPAGHVAERRFDAFGATAEKTLSDGDHSQSGGVRTFDALGRIATETDQAGNTTRSEYTADGLVARVVSASGQVTEQTYDPGTRALAETMVTSSIGETVRRAYEIDPATGAQSAVWDPRDREGTEVRFDHDAHGNPTAVRYPDGRAITHRYDRHGRRLESTDVAGAVTRLRYTEAGWLAESVQSDREGRELARVTYEYDALGRVIRTTQGNDVVSEYSFTSASQIATETMIGPDGEVQARRRYAYDALGELTRRLDERLDPGSDQLTATSTEYRYDTRNRLIGSEVRVADGDAAGVLRRVDYTLTVGGDIAVERVAERPGSSDERVTERAFEYGPTGQLTRVATTDPTGSVSERVLEYDAAGNLTRTGDGIEYGYNAANQVVAHTGRDGVTTRTGYWATGKPRAAETADPIGGHAASIVRYWDGATLVNDVQGDGAGAGVASYLFGASRHARTVQTDPVGAGDEGAERISYYSTDRHGNVTALTASDGTVTEEYAYSDYGREIAPPSAAAAANVEPHSGEAFGLTRNPFRYAGEYTDPDGTQLLAIRVYDPETMRLISRDPADQFSKYHFAGLNPIRFVDPTGRTPQVDVGNVLVGIGIAASAIGIVSSMAMTGGAILPMIGAGLFGLFDLGVAVALHVAETSPSSVSQSTKLTLGGIAAVTGIIAMVGPWFLGTKGSTLKKRLLTDEEWVEMAAFTTKGTHTEAQNTMLRLVPQWEKLNDHLSTAAGTFALNQSLGILGVTKADLIVSLRQVDRLMGLRSPNPVKVVARNWRLEQLQLQVPDDVVNRIWFYAEQDRQVLGTTKMLAKWFQDDVRDLNALVSDGGLVRYASKYPEIRSMLDSIVAKVEQVLGRKITDFGGSY